MRKLPNCSRCHVARFVMDERSRDEETGHDQCAWCRKGLPLPGTQEAADAFARLPKCRGCGDRFFSVADTDLCGTCDRYDGQADSLKSWELAVSEMRQRMAS